MSGSNSPACLLRSHKTRQATQLPPPPSKKNTKCHQNHLANVEVEVGVPRHEHGQPVLAPAVEDGWGERVGGEMNGSIDRWWVGACVDGAASPPVSVARTLGVDAAGVEDLVHAYLQELWLMVVVGMLFT